jgi:hypothetical protein
VPHINKKILDGDDIKPASKYGSNIKIVYKMAPVLFTPWCGRNKDESLASNVPRWKPLFTLRVYYETSLSCETGPQLPGKD